MNLTQQDFADFFGTTVEALSDECRQLIEQYNFNYRVLSNEEHEDCLSRVLERIDSNEFSVAGPSGKARWDKGWGENLEAFVSGGHDLSALMPKYYRSGQPLRLRQQYIVPEDPYFETKWYEIFRLWIFKTYLNEVDNIYEFGCGSGFNIATLAELYPDKEIHGLDWVEASKDIVEEMRRVHGSKTFGHVFDFFHPDQNLKIADNSAVVTIGGLEQIGTNNGKFLEYLMDSAPALVVHVEPILDWYDPSNPIDDAAVRFHKKRNYLEGYLGRLYDLEKTGRIEILKKKRAFFGSLYLEGWSQLIWRPVVD